MHILLQYHHVCYNTCALQIVWAETVRQKLYGEGLIKGQPCRPIQYQIKQFCNVLLAK